MAADVGSLSYLPRPLRKALLDFQREGIRFGISKKGRCLIGDEMGLGKTLQAISIAYYYKEAWPLLIIAPSSVKFSWIDEIEKWLPEIEPYDLNLIRSGVDISNLSKRRIHIVGYGLLSRTHTSDLLLKALEAQKFQVIIMDESHYLKNKNTKRTKRLHSLSRKAKYIILLSGTPSLARPEELYTQLDIVCPGQFGSFTTFANRYCDRYKEFIGHGKCWIKWNTRGASNLNELYQLLRQRCMIRRLKKDVLTQLPPKRRQKIAFDVSQESKHMKELESLKSDFKKCSAILKGEASEDESIQSPLMEMNRLSILLYHYTGLVKIVPIQEYISNLIESMDGKMIVFFRHRLVMKGIIQQLVSKKVKYICIAGDVPSGIRGDLVNQFQCDHEVRAAVLSIEAASFGLTLTAAHHVVFAELHFTPGMIIQAEDRAHRIGQTLPVNVHYLIARGTLDEILWSMIRRKVYVTSSALDGECKEFQIEDGNQEESQRLSACAAWVQDQEEDDENDLEEFVMEQLSSKTAKTDNTQRDLRGFFSPALSTSKDCSLMIKEKANNLKEANIKEEPVSVLDRDDEDLLNSGYLQDFTRIKEAPAGNHYKDTPQEAENVPSEDLQTGGKLDAQSNTVSPLESPYNKDPCPLKPKMLKFKKEKDDKLHSSASKSNVTLSRGETSSRTCLDFVGDDPETDSQTMESYLENPRQHLDVKSCEEDKGICGAAVRSEGNRSFFVSLKDADAECVLVVCKKGTGLPKQEKVNENSSDNEHGVEEIALTESDRTERTENGSGNNDNQNELETTCAKDVCSDQMTAVSNPLDSSHVDCEVAGSDPNDSSSSERVSSSNEAFTDEMIQHLPSRGFGNTTCGSYVDGGSSLSNRQDQCEQDFADKNELNKDPSLREEGIRSVDVLGSFCKCSSSDSVTCSCSNEPVKLHEETSGVQITMESHGGDSSDEFEHSKTRKVPPPRPSVPKKGRRQKTKRKPKNTTVTPRDWSCTACTFINNGQLVECSICLTPRVTTNECESKEADMNVLSNQGFGNVKNNGINPVVGLVDTSFRTDADKALAAFENTQVGADSLTNTAIKNTCNSATMNHSPVQCRTESLGRNVNNIVLSRSQSCSLSGPIATEKESMERVQVNRGRLESSNSARLREQAEAGDNSGSHLREPPPWSCSACTFLNQWQMIECSLCLTPRRRSQRLTATQWSTSTVDRQRKQNHNKKSSEQEDSPGSGDVPEDCRLRETEIVPLRNSCSQISLKKAGSVDLGMKTDNTRGSMAGVEKGLTPESGDRSNGETLNRVCRVPNNKPCFQSCSDFTGEEDSSLSSDDSASLRSNPRKRFKLNDCQVNGASEDSCGISDDLDQLLVSCGVTSGTSSPKNANLENLETSSLGDSLQPALSSPAQISTLDNLGKETLEELEAAANEMFSASDWEEDDFWCEAEACSGQSSSLPSSNETVSPGNQGLETPSISGFRKCSDLFSLTDLQNKLLASPNLENIESLKNGNNVVDAKQTLPADVVCNNKMPSTSPQQESMTCDSFPEVEEDEDGELAQPPRPMKLKFCLSFYTDRVYLYDEDSTPLNVNFSMSDVKHRNVEDLPIILHNEHNLKQANRFLQSWNRMGEGKRRVLRTSALVIDDPLLGYESARQGMTRETSYIRHPSEDQRIQKVKDTAERVGGKVCIVTKPKVAGRKSKDGEGTGNKASKGQNLPSRSLSHSTLSTDSTRESSSRACHQAVGADGTPLCLFCSAPVDFGDRVSCSAWDRRFCSFDCKKEYQVRNSGAAVRRTLFESEHGICQLCSLNAHDMYSAVKALPVKERPAFLSGTVYATLPKQTLKRMVMDPKEGMFWEADHIRAVAEGGGQCGLDNYRTLCVPCHRKATLDLNSRLRRQKVMHEAAGGFSISTFFQPVS